MEHATLLIADDDTHTQKILSDFLTAHSYRVVQARDGMEALRVLQDEPVDLLLLDLLMPQLDGLAVLRALADRQTTTPVIVLSAYGTVQMAVEAMKFGAYDFLEKPLHLEHLRLTLRRALDHARLQQDHARLLTGLRAQSALVGQSLPMRQVADLIARVAATPVTVLIQGESGTGKELVARATHAASPRAGGPYVVVNCAALPGELIESELFGHARGAFTGAVQAQAGKVQLADRGTLFLDEIGDMSLAAQSKSLRMLESGEVQPLGQARPTTVSVRVLAATNKDLMAESMTGRFRADLYHRLNVITILVPPLRDRREDIPELVHHFLAGFCAESGLQPKIISPEAMGLLMAGDWPGNVRELKHAVQKLAILVDGAEIGARDVEVILGGGVLMNHVPPGETPHEGGTRLGSPARVPQTELLPLREARRQFKRAYILECLAAHGGQVQATAQTLKLKRQYLYRKMKELGIEPGEWDTTA